MRPLRFDDLPDWSFTVEERSAGVYVVQGFDEAGRSIQLSGEDPEELISRARADAANMGA